MTLDELADRLSAAADGLPEKTPKFLQAAAIIINSELKQDMAAGKSPDGTAFKPLAHPRPEGGNAQPLRDQGLLLASLGGGPNHVQRIAGFSLTLGTNLPYAHVHQDGMTITAPDGKALAIPLTKQAKRAGKPSQYPGYPESLKLQKGRLIDTKTGVPQYRLVKKSVIPARPFVGFSQALRQKLVDLALSIYRPNLRSHRP